MIEIHRFDSINLDYGIYNNMNKVLMLCFHNESVYAYTEVRPETWDSLVKAPSPGSFFSSSIKPGHHYVRIK